MWIQKSRYRLVAYLLISTVALPTAYAKVGLTPLKFNSRITQGSIQHFAFSAPVPCQLSGAQFNNRFIPIAKGMNSDQQLVGFFVAGRDFSPQTQPFTIYCLDADGAVSRFNTSVEIVTRAFGMEHLRLPRNKVDLTPDQKRRAAAESSQIRNAIATVSNQSYPLLVAPVGWQGPFLRPVNGRVTSPFGRGRTQNGQPRSPHLGVDLRAPTGTTVKATNDGEVLLVGDFLLPGKSVFIHHGGSLVTAYLHLDQTEVESHQSVRKGQPIGKAGATGRVNAPHLHWQAYFLGTKFDPLNLLEITVVP